jgi:haloalkane dehalogenase
MWVQVRRVLCAAMDMLRTPDARFAALSDFPYQPHYVDIGVRVHYVDEGPRDADPVLLMHGEPSWSYLWRHVIPVLLRTGHRVVALDLVGFGRSDKPAARGDHTYARHVGWMGDAVAAIGLRNITLVCHDWGGLIGLRMVAADGERFARVVATNTGLPTGDAPMPEAFQRWRELSQTVPAFDAGRIIQGGSQCDLPEATVAAYNAPFPDDTYQAGPRQMPTLVPATPDDPASADNRVAWQRLGEWRKPFLCAFSDSDPITRGADRRFRELIPGCAGQPHTTIRGGGHFLQEDQGAELGRVVTGFIAAS